MPGSSVNDFCRNFKLVILFVIAREDQVFLLGPCKVVFDFQFSSVRFVSAHFSVIFILIYRT